MTKTQDGVPQTHNITIELPRFHVKKSRDTACHVLSLIMKRLAFSASFVLCDMHATKIFMILNFSLVFMLSFWCHFEKYSLNRLWAGCKLGNITFLVIWGPLNTTSIVVCFLRKFPTGTHFWTYAPWLCIAWLFSAYCNCPMSWSVNWDDNPLALKGVHLRGKHQWLFY